jgi:hypothetical protein
LGKIRLPRVSAEIKNENIDQILSQDNKETAPNPVESFEKAVVGCMVTQPATRSVVGLRAPVEVTPNALRMRMQREKQTRPGKSPAAQSKHE